MNRNFGQSEGGNPFFGSRANAYFPVMVPGGELANVLGTRGIGEKDMIQNANRDSFEKKNTTSWGPPKSEERLDYWRFKYWKPRRDGTAARV